MHYIISFISIINIIYFLILLTRFVFLFTFTFMRRKQLALLLSFLKFQDTAHDGLSFICLFLLHRAPRQQVSPANEFRLKEEKIIS